MLVLRTFSKAYGLAGLRVGYAVAQPEIAEALRKCAVPCGVSGIAEEAALLSLQAEDELFKRIDLIVSERERLRQALIDQGWTVSPSETNFLWLPLPENADAVAAELTANGLLTRAFTDWGIRITVGTPEANDLLIKVADGISKGR